MRDKDSRQLLLAHARLRYHFVAVDSGYAHTMSGSDPRMHSAYWALDVLQTVREVLTRSPRPR